MKALSMGLWLLWLAVQPQPEQATLVIYRQREFAANEYKIRVNGHVVGTLPSNRYLKLSSLPGRLKIESVRDYFSDDQVRWLTLQPGQTHYVKAVEDIDFLSRTLLLMPVSEAQARQDLRRLKPADDVPAPPSN